MIYHVKKIVKEKIKIELILIGLTFFILFTLVWSTSHYLSSIQDFRLPLYFQWETKIPFVAWALPIYFSLDIAVAFSPFLYSSWKKALPLMLTLTTQTIIAAPFFVLLPIEMGYSNEMLTGVWGSFLFEPLGLTNIAQWNQTPSLHVAFAFTFAFIAPLNKIKRKFSIIWASLVSISTMLVHEHHLICVISGLILFVFNFFIIYPWIKNLINIR